MRAQTSDNSHSRRFRPVPSVTYVRFECHYQGLWTRCMRLHLQDVFDHVALLVSAGKLRALGKPRPNAVKFFSTVELIALLADPDWLDDATKTIGQYWRRKNARRHGVITENIGNVHVRRREVCHDNTDAS